MGTGGMNFVVAAHEKHHQKDSIAMANSQKKSGKKQRKQGLAITNLRFHGVLFNTSALHAGFRFVAGWNQIVLISFCDYCTQNHF